MREFFLYETIDGNRGILRTREVTQVGEFTSTGDVLQITMRDGRVITSKTYDLKGFVSIILEDDIIDEILETGD